MKRAARLVSSAGSALVLIAALAAVLMLHRIAQADVVRLKSGTALEGVVSIAAVKLATGEGNVELPRTSIREIRVTDRGVELRLVDGRVLAGRVAIEDMHLRTKLYSMRIAFSDVESIVFESAGAGDAQPPAVSGPPGSTAPDPDRTAYINVEVNDPLASRASLDSPLRLAIPLRGFARVVDGDRIVLTSLRRFVCDRTRIALLSVEEDDSDSTSVELEVTLEISVSRSHDKMIDIDLEIGDGVETVSKASEEDLEAEEEEETEAEMTLRVPLVEYRRWADSDAPPILYLTMHVRDDT